MCVCVCVYVCVCVCLCVCVCNIVQVGSKVVVKQPDGSLAPGTVMRLTDASWYTVGERS